MNLERFIQQAGNYEILNGWKILNQILKKNEPSYDELVRIIKQIQNTNPFLGDLLYIAIRLEEFSSGELSDDYNSQTLGEFQFLEKFFRDNNLPEGLHVLDSLKKEFPEVLIFLDENCAKA